MKILRTMLNQGSLRELEQVSKRLMENPPLKQWDRSPRDRRPGLLHLPLVYAGQLRVKETLGFRFNDIHDWNSIGHRHEFFPGGRGADFVPRGLHLTFGHLLQLPKQPLVRHGSQDLHNHSRIRVIRRRAATCPRGNARWFSGQVDA